MCLRALNRITDQQLLYNLAVGGKFKVYHTESIIRKSAVDKIYDPAILADIAKNDSASDVNYYARNRLQALQGGTR